MNFFRQQELARRNTQLLMALFLLAVTFLITITLLLFIFFLWHTELSGYPSFWDAILQMGDKLAAMALLIILVIGIVSLHKWYELRQGSYVIAEKINAKKNIS